MLYYRHGMNPQTDGGGEKGTKAPVTLKGVLGTASPYGAVHVGPTDALGVGGLRINPSSGLNRCDKTFLVTLSHADLCTVFSTGCKVT